MMYAGSRCTLGCVNTSAVVYWGKQSLLIPGGTFEEGIVRRKSREDVWKYSVGDAAQVIIKLQHAGRMFTHRGLR